MIQNFLDSWELFRNTYLTGWLMAVVLSLTGVVVVARDQIFIGAALSQASALGVAVALWVGSLVASGGAGHEEEYAGLVHSGAAILFSVLAAMLTVRGERPQRESHESIVGWVFLVSASVSVLLISHSPHGLEEIQRLASSSLIGASGWDVGIYAGLTVAAIVLVGWFGRRILLLATDPLMAAAVGMKTGWWTGGFALWLGVLVGLSIHVSGMLYTFGLLVLPALLAKNVCREVRPMFVMSPVLGLGAAVVGFVLANHYDFPPGQMSVAILAMLLPLLWLGRTVWAYALPPRK